MKPNVTYSFVSVKTSCEVHKKHLLSQKPECSSNFKNWLVLSLVCIFYFILFIRNKSYLVSLKKRINRTRFWWRYILLISQYILHLVHISWCSSTFRTPCIGTYFEIKIGYWNFPYVNEWIDNWRKAQCIVRGICDVRGTVSTGNIVPLWLMPHAIDVQKKLQAKGFKDLLL